VDDNDGGIVGFVDVNVEGLWDGFVILIGVSVRSFKNVLFLYDCSIDCCFVCGVGAFRTVVSVDFPPPSEVESFAEVLTAVILSFVSPSEVDLLEVSVVIGIGGGGGVISLFSSCAIFVNASVVVSNGCLYRWGSMWRYCINF
jgi:hypothetical protein